MRILILSLMLNIAMTTTTPNLPTQKQSDQDVEHTSIETLNSSGLPVSLKDATAENLIVNAWLEYTITNVSSEDLSDILLRIITLNSDQGIMSTEDAMVPGTVAPGSTRRYKTLIGRTFSRAERHFVLVLKAKSNSGVWSVDVADLDQKARISLTRFDVDFPSRYEPNIVVTQRDHTRIVELILSDMLSDAKKLAWLGDGKRILILKDDLTFPLPTIANTKVAAVSIQEIQRVADKRNRAVFLRIEPPRVEGSRVLVRIVLNDREGRSRQKAGVPFRFNYLFTLIKSNDNWCVEGAIGYS
jgi:hypothetical protein